MIFNPHILRFRLMVTILMTSFALWLTPHAKAQVAQDSVRSVSRDTTARGFTEDTIAVLQAPKHFQPNPKKAGLYSSILPGSGQLYNRQYWKIPVIYAGIGVAGYFFIRNLNYYQSYRKAYIGRVNNPAPTDKYVGIYTDEQLNQLQNDYSKYLDLTVLFSAIGYSLQVIDAITSAHLKNFDISRDISMHARPFILPGGAGVTLVVNIGR